MFKARFLFLIAGFCLSSALAGTNDVRVVRGGAVRLLGPNVMFRPILFTRTWNELGASIPGDGGQMRYDGAWPFQIQTSQGKLEGFSEFVKLPNGDIRASWKMSSEKEIDASGLAVVSSLAVKDWGAGLMVVDGKEIELPLKCKQGVLWSGNCRHIVLRDGRGIDRFGLKFDQPHGVRVQDNRFFGEIFADFRLQVNLSCGAVRPKEEYRAAFVLSGKDVGEFEPYCPVVIKEDEDWVPITSSPDVAVGTALDFTKIIPCRHTPAGKYGRVVARGDNFEFEGQPGIPQRFAGANVCGSTLLLGGSCAAKLARRLASVGYNSVRIHNHDWAICGGSPNGTDLDGHAMLRFDEMFAEFKNAGLYVTTDMFVNRKVPWRSCGIDREGVMSMDEYKIWVQFHEGTYSNFLAHSRAFFGHVNACTGLRYADDPALMSVSFVNEGNIGNWGRTVFSVCPDSKEAYECFLARTGLSDEGKALDAFFTEREKMFARKTTAFLRNEMKCRILTSNMNVWYYSDGIDKVRLSEYDYLDQHEYVAHPKFLGGNYSPPATISPLNPICEGGAGGIGAYGLLSRRLSGRPFACSEWNYCAPLPYRNQAGLMMGALAASGNWSAVWRYAWSDSPEPVLSPETSPVHFFMIGSDPLALSTERALVCLFLRRDGDGLREAVEHIRSSKRLVVDSCRTAGGWGREGETINAGHLKARLRKTDSAVWASVLEGSCFSNATRIVVFHLTEVLNSNAKFADAGRDFILSMGTVPLLARVGVSDIVLTLPGTDWKAFSLDPDGSRGEEIPLRLSSGKVGFVAKNARKGSSTVIAYELFRKSAYCDEALMKK